jgi:3-dehydroquinate synthase
VKVSNDFVISPRELRTAEIREQLRGYSRDEVEALFERAAQTLDWLAQRARGVDVAEPPNVISARELLDGDIRDAFKGYHKDTVNDLAERAARTMELLEARAGAVGADPVVVPAVVPPSAGFGSADFPAPDDEIFVLAGDQDGAGSGTDDDDTIEANVVSASGLVAPLAPPAPPPPVGPVDDIALPSEATAITDRPAVAAIDATDAVVSVSLGERSYDIHVGPHAVDRLVELLRGRRRVAVVSQAEIVRNHGTAIANAIDAAKCDSEWFLIDDGEPAKSLATVDDLCRRFAAAGVLRGDAVLAFGGGVVGDVGGFVASVYHRGVDVIQIPTTLLAMVDSAIGGKTGVNLPEGKNLVGAFHQPRAVLADPRVLSTLPIREFQCGLGEVAKYALMGDDELAATLLDERAALARRDPAVLARVILRSAATKAGYVTYDEFERSGLRAHLNYGHTLAHAIETVAEHTLAHGEAVAIGLVFAGELAGALERIDAAAVARHRDLVEQLGLPTRAPEGLAKHSLLDVMRRDKKSAGGLTFVLAGGAGLERVDDPPEPALDHAFAAVGIR